MLSLHDRAIIEMTLLEEILLLNENPDEKNREATIRAHFADFCERKNLNRKEVFRLLKERLKGELDIHRKMDPKLYTDLDRIVLTEEERSKKNVPKRSKSKAKEDDDDAR